MKTWIILLIGLMTGFFLNAQWTVWDDIEIASNGEDLRIFDVSPEIRLEVDGLLGGVKSSWRSSIFDVTFKSHAGDLYFDSYTDILFSYRGDVNATMDRDGNFGLGITDPLAKLHLDGSLRFEGSERLDWYESGERQAFVRYNSQDMQIYNDKISVLGVPGDVVLSAKGKLRVITSDEASLVIDNNQRVGIGTTAPEYDLDVHGDVNVTGDLLAASDLRLKKEILPLENAMQKLLSLKPVSYQFRHEEFPQLKLAPGRKMGLIAQDVEKIIPDLVSSSNRDELHELGLEEFKSVNYVALIPMMIKSIQELKTELDQKTKELENLSRLITELRESK